MVRKILHEDPATADHPVSELLWNETREQPAEAYKRLSYLHNISLFLPVPLLAGMHLPGSSDLPEFAHPVLKPQQIESCPLVSGTEDICRWAAGFCHRCYGLLEEALTRKTHGE